MWLFSCAPEDPEDQSVMDKRGAEALYTAVIGLMHGIWTEDQDPQLDAAHRMVQIAKPWMIRRWSESELAHGKPLVRIPMQNAHLVDFESTEVEQAKLKTLGEQYTSKGA